ncbi:hypothetical protein RRG08_052299 [Elysia crispata]|uniref:Uncharacterized protein n=1 Tax=Elysia crispata TaxID=231223 RepID=A0AAE1AHI0_9GAST|nr:hypothetical protein RRG08_052299 [Elysia crispata]
MHHLRSQVMVTGKIIKETPRDRYMDTALLESQQKYNLSKPHMMHHLRSQVMVTGKIIKETPRDRYMDTALLESQQKYNLSKPHMMHHLRSQVMVTRRQSGPHGADLIAYQIRTNRSRFHNELDSEG